MADRVFFYVQHLLGIGHVKRAALLAKALTAAGFEVDVVSGGMAVPFLDAGGARLNQLPPLRAGEGGFKDLVDEDGRPVDEAWRRARTEKLLSLLRELRPDVVVTETYPFGRRQMRFELNPLLEACRGAEPRPLVVASVRDILQANRKAKRVKESADLAERFYDAVLVHGDPRLARFEETFPEAGRIARRLHYTGLIGEPPPPAGAAGEGEVLVSAGGGAVGERLLRAAIAARPFTRLNEAPWRLLAGLNLDAQALQALRQAAPPGVVVERYRADFPVLLGRALVSVSQGGYNTIVDVLNAGVRAVIVPYAAKGESEQTMRAARLAERGLIGVVGEAVLSARTLARAIDAAAAAPPPRDHGIDLAGAAKSARLIASWLEARRQGLSLR